MAEGPRGTLTFLFTDIEGSTQLWERYPEAMQTALARHDALLRQAIATHQGYVFKTIGDAFCAAFATAPAGLAAALAAQRALAAEAWGATGPLRVRMALHTGAAEARDGDYFGPALNRAARLMSIGHGGQTLLSLATAALVRDQLPGGATLRELGAHRLKDLTHPEEVFQLVIPGLPADFPPLTSLDAVPNNLPLQLTSFIGREREMAEVTRALASTRLLTLTGPGGSGKTRLALHVAADLVDAYPDGVWVVELAPLADPTLVPHTVAAVLGVREEPNRPLLATLADALHARQLLLVLDNCEHLLGACAALADTLLRACPRLQLLATSREVFGLAGETAWRVPSLACPDPQRPPALEGVRSSEAVRLFVERAVAVRPTFTVTAANAPAVAQICQRLDGLPLALELAAARVRVLTVEQIAARLDDRFRLLTGGSRTALPRQRTLQATIAWSEELLSEPERVLWRRLSVFAGGWTLEAAEAVCAGAGVASDAILDLLAALVDKSLVVVEEQAGEARYRLLETIRHYGGEKLREAGEAAAVRRRHRDWYGRWAERAEPELFGAAQGVWFERLEREHDNLRAALAWSTAEEGGAAAGVRLAGALWQFWWVRGYWSEGRRWLEAVLAGRRRASPAGRAKVLYRAGVLASEQGDYAAARALCEESLALGRARGSRWDIANALNWLGYMAFNQGDYAAARALGEESLALRRALGDQRGIASALHCLGSVACRQGDYAVVRALGEESLAHWRALGHKVGMAECLETLATIAGAQGQPQWAACVYGAAEALRGAIGAPLEPSERARYDQSVAAVRAALGGDAFAAAWAAGRAMPLEQVLAYASAGRSAATSTPGQPVATPGSAAT